jgi:hypothetical protein
MMAQKSYGFGAARFRRGTAVSAVVTAADSAFVSLALDEAQERLQRAWESALAYEADAAGGRLAAAGTLDLETYVRVAQACVIPCYGAGTRATRKPKM